MIITHKVEQLLAEGELNPIYLDEDYKELLISIIPTHTLTSKLFRYSMERVELSKEQIEALISDIEVLKAHNIWDVEEEQKTIIQCRESMEELEAYRKLSPSDKAKYDAELFKQFDM